MLKFSVVFTQPGPQKEPGLFQDFDLENLEKEHQYLGTPGPGEDNNGKGDEDLRQDKEKEDPVRDEPCKLAGLSGMRVAVDYDGTLTSNPRAFKKFLSRLARAGSKIYLVTGRPESGRKEIEAFVKTYGFRFDGMFFYPHPYHHDWISWDINMDARVGLWKGKVLKDLGADIIIDDNLVYVNQILKFMPGILALMPTTNERLK